MPTAAGWVKLHRQTLDNGWLQNPKLLAFWIYCLLKASHKETTVTVGFQRVNLQPGDFIFGREKAETDLKLSAQNIRTIISNLKINGNITVKVTNKFSIITVANWHTYQSLESDANSLNVSLLTNNQPATNHKQEVKKEKTIKTSPFEDGFDEFWNLYPRKVGKVAAVKAWNKLHPPQGKVLETLSWQVECDAWVKDAGKFIPHPATWLNDGRWDDEPTETATASFSQGGFYT